MFIEKEKIFQSLILEVISSDFVYILMINLTFGVNDIHLEQLIECESSNRKSFFVYLFIIRSFLGNSLTNRRTLTLEFNLMSRKTLRKFG